MAGLIKKRATGTKIGSKKNTSKCNITFRLLMINKNKKEANSLIIRTQKCTVNLNNESTDWRAQHTDLAATTEKGKEPRNRFPKTMPENRNPNVQELDPT